MADRPSTLTLIGLGSAIAGLVVVGLLIGFFVDRSVGTTPIFTFVGLAVGMGSAVGYAYVQFRKFL